MKQNLENKDYSFLELLEKVGIKIPIIQRDYAQGREEEKAVRERFVNSLFDAVSKNEPLYLDFIYGTIKDNYLIPLDGQQRLTTLFLLHYYLALALKENKLDKVKEKLLKFTYETRISSREFCKLLVESKIELNNKISDTIKNQTWFFSEWENDPTIKSMLTMLDTIDKKFKNCENCFDKLNNIKFSFLNLEDFQLTDELYIKMNARGKPLSNFENFKSHFVECIDKINLPNKEYIKAKLDNEWLDIFWNLEKDNLKNGKINKLEAVEEKYLNFFKNITAFFSKDFKKVDMINFAYNKYHINIIVQVLELLKNYKKYQQIISEIRDNINIFEDFIGIDSSKEEYLKRMRFYALILYFINNNFDAKEFKEWMRVSLNIIHNTLYNTLKEFKRDRKLLHKLIKLTGNEFYKKLSESKLSNIEQFKEEKLKAKLISKNPKWEDEFIKIEQNWYLDGKIGFLIEFAGGENNFDLDNFKEYRNKFTNLWNFAKDNEDNKILFYRALLTKGDYLPRIGSNKTFCSFDTAIRTKQDTWFKVFNDIKKRNYLKKLFDDASFNTNNIQNSLKNIVNNWLKNNNCNDSNNIYLYSFISNKRNIKYCEKLQIRHINDYKVYLLKTTQMNGKHSELYSYDLFCKKFGFSPKKNRKNWWRLESNKDVLPFSIAYYYETSSSWDIPCIVLDEWNCQNNSFTIELCFDETFKLYFYEVNEKEVPRDILNILNDEGFEKIESWYQKNTDFSPCEMNELMDYLETLLQQFKNINY